MQRVELSTLFDLTQTNVKGHRRNADLDDETYNYKRNQQRNYETVLQCIGLRCQPLNIKGPWVFSNNEGELYWQMSFETDREQIFAKGTDPLGILKQDFNGVPMIVGLDETYKDLFFTPYMITEGKSANTIFTQI